MQIDDVTLDRFLSHFKVNTETDCWEWQLLLRRGYGSIEYKGLPIRAHRFSWMIYEGDIPDGLQVCHHCDNRCCVNPEHLFVGTSKENIQDAWKKERLAAGEKHYNARLSDEQIAEIRSICGPARLIAERFGVSESHICRIRRGIKRSHLHPDLKKLPTPDGWRNHKISLEQRRQILSGNLTAQEIADQFNVSYGYGWQLVNKRKSWASELIDEYKGETQ